MSETLTSTETMNTYTWISAKTPKNIYTGRTIKHLKERAAAIYSFEVARIKFRFETVYCAVSNGCLIAQPGFDDVPFKRKALRVGEQIFWAAGLDDLYAPMNEHGKNDESHDGWTDAGRAWVGAMHEDAVA